MDGDRDTRASVTDAQQRADDLADRWRRARRAALRAVINADPKREDSDVLETLAEPALLARAAVLDLREVMRRGFDHSRRLGRGYALTYGGPLTLQALTELLPLLGARGAPCLRGSWSVQGTDADAACLTRPACEDGAASEGGGPHLCDWWREVTDGLVIGLSAHNDDVVRHARHRSRGHGDTDCVDVLYARAESPLRYGAIPDSMRAGLDAVARTLKRFDSRHELTFLGVSEGVLLYQRARAGCADEGALDLSAALEKSLARRFPGLATQEISPRGVLAEEQ